MRSRPMKTVLAAALLFGAVVPALTATSRREGQYLVAIGAQAGFGANYRVNVYPAGGVATANSTGTTITVASGHGVSAGQKVMVGTDTTKYRTVGSVGATSIVLTSAVTVSIGDKIVNLGADTGVSSPLYDGSTIPIYAYQDSTGTVASSLLTANANGAYGYWVTQGTTVWELIRNSSLAPTAVLIVTPSGGGGSGTGDMERATYDPGVDGTVDAAATATLATTASTALDVACTTPGCVSASDLDRTQPFIFSGTAALIFGSQTWPSSPPDIQTDSIGDQYNGSGYGGLNITPKYNLTLGCLMDDCGVNISTPSTNPAGNNNIDISPGTGGYSFVNSAYFNNALRVSVKTGEFAPPTGTSPPGMPCEIGAYFDDSDSTRKTHWLRCEDTDADSTGDLWEPQGGTASGAGAANCIQTTDGSGTLQCPTGASLTSTTQTNPGPTLILGDCSGVAGDPGCGWSFPENDVNLTTDPTIANRTASRLIGCTDTNETSGAIRFACGFDGLEEFVWPAPTTTPNKVLLSTATRGEPVYSGALPTTCNTSTEKLAFNSGTLAWSCQTDADGSGVYLPLAGGTLTGTLLQTLSANTGGVNNSGYSITGSGTTGYYGWTGTLNTSGVVPVFKYNVTNTASGTGTRFFDWQRAGSTMFSLDMNGGLRARKYLIDSDADGTATAFSTGDQTPVTIQGEDDSATALIVAATETADGFGYGSNSSIGFKLNVPSFEFAFLDRTYPRIPVGQIVFGGIGGTGPQETLTVDLQTGVTQNNPQMITGFHNAIGGSVRNPLNGAKTQTGVVTNASIWDGTYTVPANAWKSASLSRQFKFEAWGLLTTAAASCGNMTINLRLNGSSTIIGTGAQALTCNQTDRMWHVEGWISQYTLGVSGTIRGQGMMQLFTTADVSTVAAPAMEWLAMKSTTTTTIDTTAANTFDLVVTFSATGNTIVSTNYNMQLVS